MNPAPLPDPERWALLKSSFQAAMERPPAERDAFVAATCVGDAELLRELRSLLSHADAERFLEEPARVPAALVESDDADAMVGRTLGPYHIVSVIGRGGMGTVYRAMRADDVYEKAVALKLVKRGMDTDFILKRFRAERQILAQLDHPHIARLLDGGTSPDGRPYFVMEYIEGLPLDRYAEAHGLETRARLELFLAVCAAAQHAHQSLIVHRDLKPANILVTGEGRPKLLDFGIAKLLDPESAAEPTGSEARLMTPEYATPEQVRGEAITTATDVYALGIVLYELLAGRRPYRGEGRTHDELVQAICHEEPLPPSQHVKDARRRRILAGELDNIVLMALRKEPARRYASIEQLADDLRRHLDGRPVRAQKDTFAYRASKFLRRNRLSVAAAAVLALTLVAGIVTTSWQVRVARAERARAERRFGDVRRLANTFLFQFHDEIRDLPGSTKARQMLVTEALRYLDSLATESQGDDGLQRELAAAYKRVGDVQGRAGTANLGDSPGALVSYRKALALYDELGGTAPRDGELQADRLACHLHVARLQEMAGDAAGSIATLAKARTVATAALALSPDNVRLQTHFVSATSQLGDVHQHQGDLPAAIAAYRESVSRGETVCAAHPEHLHLRRVLAVAYVALGATLKSSGDHEAELAYYGKALSIHEGLIAAEPQSARHPRNLATVHVSTGLALARMKRWLEAIDSGRAALAITRVQAEADPENADAKHMLFAEELLLCEAETQAAGRTSARCPSALTRAQALAAVNFPGRMDAQLGLLEAYVTTGAARAHARDWAGALEAFGSATVIAESAGREWPSHPQPRLLAGQAQAGIGGVRSARSEWTKALEAYRAAAALWESSAAAGHGEALGHLFEVQCSMAGVHARQRQWATARDAYRQALGLLDRPRASLVFRDGASAERRRAARGLAEIENR